MTFTYLVRGASTNWTGFDLLNGTFQHSPLEYTVSVRNSTSGAEAVFNSSLSSWRVGQGPPSPSTVNWIPATGTSLRTSDLFQFQSVSNLTASGLVFELSMYVGSCGPGQTQGFLL